MKIVLIVDYYYPAVGGAETLYQHLAEGLITLGHKVIVLTQLVKGSTLEETLNGVNIHRVATSHRAAFPYQAFKLAKSLVTDADIVQAGPYSAGILAAKLRKFTKAKIILSVYEYLGKRWLRFGISGVLAFFYEKYLFGFKFDHYVAISDSTKGQLLAKGIQTGNITRIYCGVDNSFFKPQPLNISLRKELGIESERFICLYAGRPGVTKGVWVLLATIERIRNSGFGIRNEGMRFVLVLAREPAKERGMIIQFIKKYQLEENVLVLDSVPRENLPSYLAMANVIVVPSLTEGFGFFAAEVSAMGIPLVVSNVDALPEVVSGKVVLVESGNAEALAEGLMSASEGKFIEVAPKSFRWDDTWREYEKLYKSLKK